MANDDNKEEINPYWKKRNKYTLLELAYLAAGENPKTYIEFRKNPNQQIISFIKEALEFFFENESFQPVGKEFKETLLSIDDEIEREKQICKIPLPLAVANLLMKEVAGFDAPQTKPHIQQEPIAQADKSEEQTNLSLQTVTDATEPASVKKVEKKPKPKEFDKRLEALKKWLIGLGYTVGDELIILPKNYRLETVYSELCKTKDKDLFLSIELSSFDAHFWGKQKLVELMRGNKSTIR